MKWDKDSITLGCELELADVDTTKPIPKNLGVWDYEDYTIANSSGIGNDPKKKLVRWGGEINTAPTHSVEEQLSIVESIYSLFPEASINYTCNLHIHAGILGLVDNIEVLRKVVSYFYKYQEEIFQITEKLIPPTREEYPDPLAFKGAMKRYRRRKVSHQKKIDKRLLECFYKHSNPKDIWDCFVPKRPNGIPCYNPSRPGINVFQLFRIGTIEFRHFSMTFDLELFGNCLKWVKEIVYTALTDEKVPYQIWKELGEPEFPPFQPYDYKIDRIFQLTKFSLPRKTVKQNLIKLLEQGEITIEDIGFEDFMSRR